MATAAESDSVHLLLDLYPTSDGVSGVLTVQDTGRRQRFGGWLELLQLLEVAIAPLGDLDPPSDC
jgi:hypothetical protein